MALDKKTRKAIILLIVGIAAYSFLINQIIIEIEGIIDINPKNIYLFEKEYTIIYRYETGKRGVQNELVLSTDILNGTHTYVSVKFENKNSSFLAHPNGTVYQDEVLQGNYSIWWVYVPNVIMMFGAKAGDEYSVIDPTGFIGRVGQPYDLLITRKRTYWPSDPELSNLLGAQSSFDADLYNKSNNHLVAKVTFDITCGIIEVWEGTQSSVELILTKTNFPMSRNRISGIFIEIVLGIALVLVGFLLMSQDSENQFLTRFHRKSEERSEIILLLFAGVLAITIEMVDIWFYLSLGLVGNIGMHIGYTLFLGAICWKQKYGYQWLTPSLLEIGFVLALNFVTGDPYVPSITAFMGSTISCIALVWASGIEKYLE